MADREERPDATGATGPDDAPDGAGADALSGDVARLTADDVVPAERRALLGRIAKRSGRRLVLRPRSILGWVTDSLVEIAPRLPIRDLEMLRRHYDGLDGDELADRLVRNASRVTAAIGAGGGGVTAVQWTAPPTLLTAPVVLAAETLGVAAVEVKLIGELHAVYRVPLPGSGSSRAVALLQAWADRRGVNPMVSGRGVAAVLSTAARKELRDRLVRRFGRNLTTLGPLLTGAVVAAELNRRATRAIGESIRRDLSRRTGREVSQTLPDQPPTPPDRPR